jgi:hypothetical protein
MMITVAVVGAGIAAMIRPTRGWAIVLPALFLTVLLTAILGLLLRRGDQRAYWVGFALFGWAYLIPSLFWLGDFNSTPISISHVVSFPLIVVLDIVTGLGASDGKKSVGEMMAELHGVMAQVDDKSRLLVAWSLLGLLFACLGSLIARWLSRNEATSMG